MNYEEAITAPVSRTGTIKLHGEEGFKGMRNAGRLAASVLDFITPHVQPGITTEALDKLCHDYILDHNAIPAPLNYKGFPKSICTSVNHVICHGIPGKRILKSGDSVNIDVTVILDGWHGDTSRMFFVGQPKLLAQRLCQVTFDCMWKGIEQVKPGNRVGDIGAAIQKHAEENRFSVVREFCGHGLGQVFHDEPSIMHYGRANTGPELKPGMFFTIEPMINAGRKESKILQDGWTAVTRDKSLSMQFEHSLAVTETGYEIFTSSPKGWDCPPYSVNTN